MEKIVEDPIFLDETGKRIATATETLAADKSASKAATELATLNTSVGNISTQVGKLAENQVKNSSVTTLSTSVNDIATNVDAVANTVGSVATNVGGVIASVSRLVESQAKDSSVLAVRDSVDKVVQDGTVLDMAADVKNLSRIATAVELIAGVTPSQSDLKSFEDIRKIVRAGKASSVFNIGDQIFTPLNGNDYNVEQFAWDVVHHFDGSDDDHPLVTLENGKQVKGMMLQAHRTVPWAIPWEPKQAAIAVTGDMPAGTYHFTVKVTGKWGTGIAEAVGETTYQFTTTQALSAGAQLVWSEDGYSVKPTAMKLNAYASGTSTTIMEACAVSEGSGGTDLGVMNDSTPSTNSTDYALLNNIERAIYGSNRWSTSQERVALNAATVAQGGTKFSRPWNLVGKAGLPACLPEEFVGVLGKVERKQELHPWDGGEVETTYDTFFPISSREHCFNTYLSQTTTGWQAEGVMLDYWKQLAAASGRTVPFAGWKTYPELITYDSVATTTARYVWLRSANRYANYAYNVGCVSTSGYVSSSNASYGYFAAPACIIV